MVNGAPWRCVAVQALGRSFVLWERPWLLARIAAAGGGVERRDWLLLTSTS